MNGGMEGFYPPVHDFGKASDFRHIRNRQAGVSQRGSCAAGGDQVETQAPEPGREIDHAGLVGHADQCAPHAIALHAAKLPVATLPAAALAEQLVMPEFLAQGGAIDPKDLGRHALVALGVVQHRLEEGFFDFAQNQFIQIPRPMAVEIAKVFLQGFFSGVPERAVPDANGGSTLAWRSVLPD